MIFFTEWFQIQREFATLFEEMSPPELNKCLQKFYLSARKRDGSFYDKKSLTATRTALDRHLLFQSFPRGKILESLLKCMNQILNHASHLVAIKQNLRSQITKQVVSNDTAVLYRDGAVQNDI